MDDPPTTPRRTLFRAWVIVPTLLLVAIIVAAPFIETGREGFAALLYPPILAALVFVALGWLVWFVFVKRGREGRRTP
ncbi:MAG: hypothetical protein KDG89_12410 [Geminicoccaceae bacterium]|nr:hypothetical protein [Geminicoccaceae bacterium]